MEEFERALLKGDKTRRGMNIIIRKSARDIYEEVGISEKSSPKKEDVPPNLSDLILEEESRRNYSAWIRRQIYKWEDRQ